MPRGDGTGPYSQGPGTGRVTGKGRNQGNYPGAGPGGSCVCPSCEDKVAHKQGVPCYNENCPLCGAEMVRE